MMKLLFINLKVNEESHSNFLTYFNLVWSNGSNALERWHNYEKLLITRQNKWKLTIEKPKWQKSNCELHKNTETITLSYRWLKNLRSRQSNE